MNFQGEKNGTDMQQKPPAVRVPTVGKSFKTVKFGPETW